MGTFLNFTLILARWNCKQLTYIYFKKWIKVTFIFKLLKYYQINYKLFFPICYSLWRECGQAVDWPDKESGESTGTVWRLCQRNRGHWGKSFVICLFCSGPWFLSRLFHSSRYFFNQLPHCMGNSGGVVSVTWCFVFDVFILLDNYWDLVKFRKCNMSIFSTACHRRSPDDILTLFQGGRWPTKLDIQHWNHKEDSAGICWGDHQLYR